MTAREEFDQELEKLLAAVRDLAARRRHSPEIERSLAAAAVTKQEAPPRPSLVIPLVVGGVVLAAAVASLSIYFAPSAWRWLQGIF